MRLVERILTAKQAAPDADLPAPRLRQAGGLTADEIKLVEDGAK